MKTEQARGREGPSGLLAHDQAEDKCPPRAGGLSCISGSVHVAVCTFNRVLWLEARSKISGNTIVTRTQQGDVGNNRTTGGY